MISPNDAESGEQTQATASETTGTIEDVFPNSKKIFVNGKLHEDIKVPLREISLDELEYLTGLYLWGNVRAEKFKQRRDDLSKGDWWKEGQPDPKKATAKKTTAKKAKSKIVKKKKTTAKKAKSKKAR